MLQNYFVQLLFSVTLLLFLATFAALVFRKSSASTRHRIWIFSIIGLLILPLLIAFVPKKPIRTVAIHVIEKTETPALHGDETIEAVPPHVESPHSYEPGPVVLENRGDVESPQPQVAARGKTFSWATVGKTILGVWAFGTILLLSRFILSLLGVCRLMKRLHPLKDAVVRQIVTEITKRLDVRRPVRLLQSEVSSSVPFTTGIFAPIIVVPPEFTEWDESRRRSVLTHEMGHVARRDVAWQILCKIAVALYWFHPLVWLAAWRIRIERELACDDLVLLHGEKPSDYANVLLELADNLKGRDRRHVLGCTVAMARKNAVRQRIVSILNPATKRTPLGKIGSAFVLLLAVVGIFVAAMLGPPKTEYEVSASEPATATRSVISQNIQPEEKEETIDDLLTELSGRIVDESDKPLKGVILRLVESQDNRNKLHRLSERSRDLDKEIHNRYHQMFLHGGDIRFSEDDGTFKMKTFKKDEVLLIISPGLANREIRTTNTLRTTTRGNLGDIVLHEGIAPTVCVLTPDGNPLSDVWVNLFPVDETGSIYIGKSGISYGGKFTFPPVEPGEYNVSISKRGSRNAVGRHASSPFISSPDVRLVPFAFPEVPVTVSKESKEFTIQALETVTVMLRFQGGRNPNISRWNPSTVFFTDPNDKTGLNWKCTWEEGDAMDDGVYRFRVPKNVPIRFALPHDDDNTFYVAVLPGHKDPITTTDSPLSEKIPLKPALLPAMQNDCDIKIARITRSKTEDVSQIPDSVTVTITDENGKPMKDVLLKVRLNRDKKEFRSDENGKVVVDTKPYKNVVSGWFIFDAYTPGRVTTCWRWLQLKDRRETIPPEFTIRLLPGYTIGGTVVDEQGTPVAGAKVVPDYDFRSKVRTGNRDEQMPRPIWEGILTDAQGKWRAEGYSKTNGQIMIGVTHDDFLPQKEDKERSAYLMDDILAGKAKTVMKRGFPVHGTVRDGKGNPIPGVKVCLDNPDIGNMPSAVRITDAQGRYEIKSWYRITTRYSTLTRDWAPEYGEVDFKDRKYSGKGGATLDFTLKKGKSIRLKVTDPNGNPIKRFWVCFHARDSMKEPYLDELFSAFSNDEGIWEWKNAPDEEFRFDVDEIRGYDRIYDVKMKPREEPYVVTAKSTTFVSGSVVDSVTKKPLEKFQIVRGMIRTEPHPDYPNEYWNRENPRAFKDGVYSLSFESGPEPKPGEIRMNALRFEAVGYEPWQSKPISFDGSRQKYVATHPISVYY